MMVQVDNRVNGENKEYEIFFEDRVFKILKLQALPYYSAWTVSVVIPVYSEGKLSWKISTLQLRSRQTDRQMDKYFSSVSHNYSHILSYIQLFPLQFFLPVFHPNVVSHKQKRSAFTKGVNFSYSAFPHTHILYSTCFRDCSRKEFVFSSQVLLHSCSFRFNLLPLIQTWPVIQPHLRNQTHNLVKF